MVGGLATATLLALLVLPAVYALWRGREVGGEPAVDSGTAGRVEGRRPKPEALLAFIRRAEVVGPMTISQNRLTCFALMGILGSLVEIGRTHSVPNFLSL